MKKLFQNKWFYTAIFAIGCLTTFAVGCDEVIAPPDTPDPVTATTLTVKAVSKENKVGNTAYSLYDLTVDNAQVQVKISNAGGQVIDQPLSQFSNGQIELESGEYTVVLTYQNNAYEHTVNVVEGQNTTLNGYVSPVNLGGSVTTTAGTFPSYGSGYRLLDGFNDSIAVERHTYAFNHQTTGSKYYVEGVFNSTHTYDFRGNFGGLLLSHGPASLANNTGDAKLMAGIRGKSVVIVANAKAYNPWTSWDMRTVANFDSVLSSYEPTAVKLGVLRDGTKYWFFVNDVYVGDYVWEGVTTESGFGVACTADVCTQTIQKFNYSFNSQYVNALKALAPQTNKSIDIYLIAGQSNAAGFSTYQNDSITRYDERLIYGVQNIWYSGSVEAVGANATSVLYPHEWTLSRVGQGEIQERIGPEAGMALALSQEYNATTGKTAGFIKFAMGGTSLMDNVGGANATGGNWVSPSYQTALGGGQSSTLTGWLYRKFIAQVQKSVNDLKTLGYSDVNMKGMYWMQGESDTWGIEEYKRAFGYFIDDVRRDIGAIVQEDMSAMPLVVGEISRTSGSYERQETNERFVEMQRSLATTHSNVVINPASHIDVNTTAGKVPGSDGDHYAEADCLTIGRMVGNLIINVTNRYEVSKMTSIVSNADGSVNILSPATGDPATYKYVVEKTQRTSFTAEATFVYQDGDFMGGFAIKQGNHTIYFALPRFNGSILLRENGSNYMYVPTKANLLGTEGSFFNGTSPSLTMRLTYANGIINLYYKDGNTYKEFINPFNIADINASKGAWQGAEEWLGANMNATQPVQAGVAFFGDGSGVGTVNHFKVTENV